MVHCHDRCQFTIDGSLSSLCHEQSFGGYPSIVDCSDHGGVMADIICAVTRRLFNGILSHNLIDGTGVGDKWQMADGRWSVVVASAKKKDRVSMSLGHPQASVGLSVGN